MADSFPRLALHSFDARLPTEADSTTGHAFSMSPLIAVAAGCGILTQVRPVGKSKTAESLGVDFGRTKKNGENRAGRKESIIGNDATGSCLFPPYAQLAWVCAADWNLDRISRDFAAVAKGQHRADAV